MRVLGIAGWSGSGKTTLLAQLIPILTGRGLRISTIKHAHHDFDIDQPGKDSWRHREAGATEVLVASNRRWALMHEHRSAPEPPLDVLLSKLEPVDLVLVEGFKRGPYPKLEIWRAATGKPPLYPDDPTIIAVASDAPITGRQRLPIDDIATIADFVMAFTSQGRLSVSRPPDTPLPDDCFAVGDRLLSIEEALAEFQTRLGPVTSVETVPLSSVEGRILAEALVADRSVPPHDNAAVDGYAVHFADLPPGRPVTLPVTGSVTAGHPLGRAAGRGEAIRIFTGAPMPAGPDTVAMQEGCTAAGDAVTIPAGLPRGANARRAGEDIRSGDTVLPAGRRLGPAEIGLAASLGRIALPVRRPLRVALVSTGDEVREPGTPIGEGQIYDANRHVLAALLRRLGCTVIDHGILPDQTEAIRAVLMAAAMEADAIVTSGGVSVGDEDHVKPALEAAGGRLHLWRLAIKPGRPVALGQIGDVPLLGLPGNPVAVMVTFLLVARPILLRLAGAEDLPLRRFPVVAGFDHDKKPARREFIRAVLEPGPAGTLVARRHGREGSGVLSSLAGTEGLVELGEDRTRLATGDPVAYIPLSALI